MVGMMKPPEAGELDALALKFRSLELDSEADLQTVLRLVKMREAVSPGENIVDTRSPVRQLTVLLAGVACLHKRLEDDSRQIYTFQYPGDFCDLHRYMLPELDRTATVTALTDCSIGTIRYDDMDQMLSQHPKLGLAFWRASMLEASILRERLLNISRRAALPRVASIICEQLVRLEAINIKSRRNPSHADRPGRRRRAFRGPCQSHCSRPSKTWRSLEEEADHRSREQRTTGSARQLR